MPGEAVIRFFRASSGSDLVLSILESNNSRRVCVQPTKIFLRFLG